ncbi:MAG: HEAT repeat domain-containing protein, partial [Methylococcales bacterium]
ADPKAVVPALIVGLGDKYWDVREAAANALNRLMQSGQRIFSRGGFQVCSVAELAEAESNNELLKN